MCGIAGYMVFGNAPSPDRSVLEAMTHAVACRGPDDAGLWRDDAVGFGHRRLAIVDPEGGAQPMVTHSADRRVALTYCGEIYNCAELRSVLCGHGHQFRTESDTEVVLRAYLQWGEQLAERLRGMYAFALWDSATRILLLVRDRLGIKPIYYYVGADAVLFGSEPKAILAYPCAPRVVDLDGVRALVAPVRVPGASIWARIKEVRPGTAVTIDASGVREREYWNLTAVAHTDDLATTIATVRELLADAVTCHWTDVPCCVLLSGGLDSSTIAAFAACVARDSGETVNTVGLDIGQDGDVTEDPFRSTRDSPFAREVARHLSATHREICFDAGAVASPEVRRATVAARDEPGLGDVDQTLYLLFRSIRDSATVAFSGEAADEVFGGYREWHDAVTILAPTFPWLAPRFGWHRMIPTVLEKDLARRLRLSEFIADTYAEAMTQVPHRAGDDSCERRMREVAYLYLKYFLPRLLDRKDRMSMATGLEVRVPFCDHRLVEYVFNTPWKIKAFDGREKSLLRAAARDLLPESVLARTKSVYPTMYETSYAATLQAQVQRLVEERANPVFAIYDRRAVADAARVPAGRLGTLRRMLCERVLELDTWVSLRRPCLDLN